VLTLFCDESGFTGQDLLNPDQPYFSYSSVLIEPQEAEEIVVQAKADFRLGNELKGSRMLSSSPGRRAAEFIFDKVVERSITVVANKQFALAGKLYEYIFDPVVEGSTALYEVGFHKCLTNLLYSQFTSTSSSTIELLNGFQRAVRTRDFSTFVESLKHVQKDTESSTLAESIGKFCFEQQGLIAEEFTPSGNEVVDKWGLELSSTCVTGLLRLWADRDVELHLVLDESKPLFAWSKAIKDHFPVKPGPQETGRYLEFQGRRHRMNFVLAEPIQFASSKITPGLQLADVMAAFIAHLLTGRPGKVQGELLARAWEKEAIDPSCIFPDASYIDPADSFAKKNLALLNEIFLASGRGAVIRDEPQTLAQKVHDQRTRSSLRRS
jgi:Protein of unknown function (DUF3800)